MSVREDCTEDCESMPECTRCRKTKAPRGRSVPLAAANGYCNSDCHAYCDDPKPGHLWRGELKASRRGDED